MNIVVLNGSPKGKNSITLQTVLYLQAKFPQDDFNVLHVGSRIKTYEKDLSPALDAIREADMLLFAYPVYTFLVPSQLHRFIELIKDSGVDLSGKFATSISTSKHFYDVTAHRFIEDNCHDLGLKYIRGLSADMDDLLSKRGQSEAYAFFRYVRFCVKKDIYEAFTAKTDNFIGSPVTVPKSTAKQRGDVVVVTDCEEGDEHLSAMIRRFTARLPRESRVVNIRYYPFKGGCMGCFHCAVSGECVYRDGFDEFLRRDIQSAEAIVYAFRIKDHSMGAAFKRYDDRQFCNGHRTVTMGMPMGYIISGKFSQEENLRTVIEARCEVGGNFYCGAATDEEAADIQIDRLAQKLEYALSNRYSQPKNFYGVGGMKIFRDLIYTMRGFMRADHQFYKEHKQYDFPQKQLGTILKMYAVGALLNSPKIKASLGSKMTTGMLMPYQTVLKQANKKKK